MFMDYDNDGDEDLYVVSGYLDAPQPRNSKEQPNALLRNDGDGTFSDVFGQQRRGRRRHRPRRRVHRL